MITNQIIRHSLEELYKITKVSFSVFDAEGNYLLNVGMEEAIDQSSVDLFISSMADSQQVQSFHYYKVMEENETAYVLVAKGFSEEVHIIGRVAVSQLQELILAYKDRFDKNSFIQNLLLDNLLVVDMFNRAKKLNIQTQAHRLVYTIEIPEDEDGIAAEVLKGLFYGRHFITSVEEHVLVLVQELEENQEYEDAERTARTICDMLNTEALSDARVAYGTIVDDIQQVSRSYKEARLAMDVGKIFYTEKKIHAYSKLGIGRLIFQLPVGLCEMFMNEVFTLQKPETFDEETLSTIARFFENNLNVSETARQLFVHRNTLVYRLEKLQKSTGLDIRNFDDALTFKIALMVVSYMKYVKNHN